MRKLFLFFLFLSLCFSVFAYPTNSSELLQKDQVYVGGALTQTKMSRTVNPFAKANSFYLQVMVAIGGGACLLILTAYDFINAYMNSSQDPDAYKKATMKFLKKLFLVALILSISLSVAGMAGI